MSNFEFVLGIIRLATAFFFLLLGTLIWFDKEEVPSPKAVASLTMFAIANAFLAYNN